MRIEPPKLLTKDETSLTIEWAKAPGNAEGYKLRYRQESDPEWSPLSETVVKGTQVRKKNLDTNKGYFFSVMPVFLAAEPPAEEWSWSASSEKLVTGAALSSGLAGLFPSTLMSKTGSVSTASALSGKVVGIYFSASWCPPCRQYTPMVADIYVEAKRLGKKFEIVFVSCDNSEEESKAYYDGHHPWLTLDYNDPAREVLPGTFQVRGIPRLVILGSSGKVIVDNVGPIRSVDEVDRWVRESGL